MKRNGIVQHENGSEEKHVCERKSGAPVTDVRRQ
jgi:hypothetical protein